MKNLRFKTVNYALAGLVLGGAMLLASCTKEVAEKTGTPYQSNQTPVRLTADQEQAVHNLVTNMPDINIVDEERGRVFHFDLVNRDFSFSTPNSDWNFSNTDGVLWEPSDVGGGVLWISAGSFGGNTGGTVIAGSSALDINYTFCFSASDEALGIDLFDFGGPADGVSMVLGIAGDFEALQEDEIDEDADFTDFFQGFAMYFVYDNEASGTYDIIDWFDDLDQDEEDLDGSGFSYVLDFENLGLYFSTSGTLNVSGGEMNFNGEYFSLIDFLLDFEDEGEDFDYSVVSGYGSMGCN